MHDFFLFVSNHWILVSLFFLAMCVLMAEEVKSNVKGKHFVDLNRVIELINHQKAAVVDIRSADKFKQGHIIRAKHLDSADLKQNTTLFNQFKKHRPIVIVSEYGTDALSVSKAFLGQGFDQVYVLQGGIVSWRKADFPLVTN